MAMTSNNDRVVKISAPAPNTAKASGTVFSGVTPSVNQPSAFRTTKVELNVPSGCAQRSGSRGSSKRSTRKKKAEAAASTQAGRRLQGVACSADRGLTKSHPEGFSR
jgi:hypothetical protein